VPLVIGYHGAKVGVRITDVDEGGIVALDIDRRGSTRAEDDERLLNNLG